MSHHNSELYVELYSAMDDKSISVWRYQKWGYALIMTMTIIFDLIFYIVGTCGILNWTIGENLSVLAIYSYSCIYFFSRKSVGSILLMTGPVSTICCQSNQSNSTLIIAAGDTSGKWHIYEAICIQQLYERCRFTLVEVR